VAVVVVVLQVLVEQVELVAVETGLLTTLLLEAEQLTLVAVAVAVKLEHRAQAVLVLLFFQFQQEQELASLVE
jgi:hypothetical protein